MNKLILTAVCVAGMVVPPVAAQPAGEDPMCDRDTLMATVEKSPQAVGVHDKQAWLDLFASSATVQDPVGSAPHNSIAARSAFYDVFIAPNTIVFDVTQDIVTGCTVWRDLTINTGLQGGSQLAVPTLLQYDVVSEGSEYKISALKAHWEIPAMVTGLIRQSTGMSDGIGLSSRMLTSLGIGGTLAYSAAFLRPGPIGVSTAATYLRAHGFTVGKRVNAGRYVAAVVQDGERTGIARVDVTTPWKVRSAHVYWDGEPAPQTLS